jgi:hypothetical protein
MHSTWHIYYTLQATEEIFTEKVQEQPSRQKQVQPLLKTLRSTCLAGLQEMSSALDQAEATISKHHKAEEQKDAQISKLRSEMAQLQIDGAKTVAQVKDEYESLFTSLQTEMSNQEAKFVERIQVLEATSANEESVQDMRAQMKQKEALVEKYSTLLKEQDTAWTKMTKERDELESTLCASIDLLKASLTKQEATSQSAAAETAALRMKFDEDLAAVALELKEKSRANKMLEAQVSAADNDVSVLKVEIESYRYVYVYVYVHTHARTHAHTHTHTHTHTHKHVYLYMHTHKHTQTHRNMLKTMRAHAQKHTPKHTHTQKHTQKHTHRDMLKTKSTYVDSQQAEVQKMTNLAKEKELESKRAKAELLEVKIQEQEVKSDLIAGETNF